MTCLTDEELTAHLLEETTPERKQEAQEHFHACSACRSRLSALRFAASAAAAVPPAPVSGDFTAKLMARIRGELTDAPVGKSVGLFTRLTAGELVFAACALTLFAAVFLHSGRGQVPSAFKTLYLTDGPATPVRLAALPSPDRLKPGVKPGEMYYSDSCRTAKCGL